MRMLLLRMRQDNKKILSFFLSTRGAGICEQLTDGTGGSKIFSGCLLELELESEEEWWVDSDNGRKASSSDCKYSHNHNGDHGSKSQGVDSGVYGRSYQTATGI